MPDEVPIDNLAFHYFGFSLSHLVFNLHLISTIALDLISTIALELLNHDHKFIIAILLLRLADGLLIASSIRQRIYLF